MSERYTIEVKQAARSPYSVWDTRATKPDHIRSRARVCVCFHLCDAEMIARNLNAISHRCPPMDANGVEITIDSSLVYIKDGNYTLMILSGLETHLGTGDREWAASVIALPRQHTGYPDRITGFLGVPTKGLYVLSGTSAELLADNRKQAP